MDSDRAHYLAYSCEGRIGAALKLKDTEILRQKNQWIDDFTDLNRPGLSDEASYSDKEELRRLLNVLAAWFRDIYLVKIGVAHSELVNLDRRDDLLRVMLRYNTLDLDAILRVICESIFYLDHNINTKLLVSNIKAQLWKR